MPKGRPRHSVWEVSEATELQLKGFGCVPPLNNEALLDDPAEMRDFVCQRNWDAYLEHCGTLYSRISKDKSAGGELCTNNWRYFPSCCLLLEEFDLWRSSLRCFHQLLEQLGCYALNPEPASPSPTWFFTISTSVWVHKKDLIFCEPYPFTSLLRDKI